MVFFQLNRNVSAADSKGVETERAEEGHALTAHAEPAVNCEIGQMRSCVVRIIDCDCKKKEAVSS